jgi:NitT/TauT family transport system ATP-binding protein
MQLSCEHLSKVYRHGKGTTVALDDVGFSVAPGEFVSVIGVSGCGKTTLLKLIAGLITPTSGTVRFSGESGGGRTRTALVFQEQGLFPWMTVLENTAFGLRLQGMEKRERLARASAFLNRVGLGTHLDFYPHQLSVGLRQRADIARAFLVDPQLLLMDEPFAALDALTRLALREELLRLWEQQRMAVLYVTHDIEEAVLLGDRVLVMGIGGGQIRADIPIPLPRPRPMVSSARADVQQWTARVWQALEHDVRSQSLERA